MGEAVWSREGLGSQKIWTWREAFLIAQPGGAQMGLWEEEKWLHSGTVLRPASKERETGFQTLL